MSIHLRKQLAVVSARDVPGLADWLAQHDGQVFRLKSVGGDAHFQALGPEDEACRTPINIYSKAPGELKLISNFAATPFELDGRAYGSVEAFWQGLKFLDEDKRREIAPLHGAEAKDAGLQAPASEAVIYGDALVRVGTWEHWQLMERATVAKFQQHARARAALLSTGDRPLTHAMKQDSRTIPGVILADIWMRTRASLRS